MKRCPDCHYIVLDNDIELCPRCVRKSKMINVDNESEEIRAQYMKDYEGYKFVEELLHTKPDNTFDPFITEYDWLKLEEEEKRRKREEEYKKSHPNAVQCPKCGSFSVATVNRGFNIVTGFLGSGSPRNVCQNCGHKWKPGK